MFPEPKILLHLSLRKESLNRSLQGWSVHEMVRWKALDS